MKKNTQTLVYLLLIAIVPTLLVWAPFFFNLENVWGVPLPDNGLQTVMSNYDGPLYIVVAKSLYNLEFIAQNYSFPLPLEYYAAHFPLYPLTIKAISYITGYPWAMLLGTLAGSALTTFYFYKLANRDFKENQALWLTFLFAYFPARWLIVKAVGSPEPLFVGSVIASIYYFKERKYWKAGFWGALAQLTKSPGILLFIALAGAISLEKLKGIASIKESIRKVITDIDFRAYPIILIPLALLGLFFVYSLNYTFGNFFAYFNSGDNIHLFFPPFQIFNYSQPWVSTHWLEEVIFIYLIISFGLLKLIKEKRYAESWFVGIFFLSIIFVSHRDIMRYALPVVPFLFLAFAKELQKTEAKVVFLFLILPVYLFTLAFISNNAMPISDWTPLL